MRALERRIAKLEAAVAKEHSHAITIRNQWFEILNSCKRMRPYGRRSSKKADMMEKGPSVQKDSATLPLKVTFQRRELYKVKTELDDENKSTETDGTD